MLKHYLKTAFRSLEKSKFYTAINIGGLAIGLATAIMLLLWVQHERSYDRFHENHKSIYQLSAQFDANGELQTWTGVPGPLSVYAKSIPQVESVVRIDYNLDQVLSLPDKSKILDGNRVAFVDSGFFKMFDFKLLTGTAEIISAQPNSLVLTESVAKRFFGEGAAVGQRLLFRKEVFTVAAVMEDFPDNSSLSFDAVLPMSYYAREFTNNGGNGEWKTIDTDLGNYSFSTFVQLHPGADPGVVGKKFSGFYAQARNGDSSTRFQLQNLADIHLIKPDGNKSAQRMVNVFMLVAVLLLVIAGVNYVNLSTARALIRAKEVSMRKIIGADRIQLFFQFCFETFVLFCMAAIVAAGLVYLFMPLYNEVSGKKLRIDAGDLSLWVSIGWAVGGTLLLSMVYPAFLLSSFRPMEFLKGRVASGVGMNAFRKGLVVFQFAISLILLVCTLVMSNQIHYLNKKELGYDRQWVFSVPLPQTAVEHLETIKTNLGANPGILAVSASNAYDFTSVGGATMDISWKGKPQNAEMIITELAADKDFIPAMGITFLEGENFSGMPGDSNKYILNETAVRRMGLEPPYVGREISFHNRMGTIAGVVKDFHFESLKTPIAPFIFYTFGNNKNILYVRTTAEEAPNAIAATEREYKKYAGDVPFAFSFLDKNFDEKYKSDMRAGLLFRGFAGIAIFISCLGLFALATYTAQVRRKEIGVRKVLGASVGGIVGLMGVDFLKPVLIAIALGVPVSWWAMNEWLQGFAYRTELNWQVFALAGAVAVFIALLTVSVQAIKAAVANPVESLKAE